ncbi:MAG: hypothetical protein IJH78_05175 [Clostridia bacterium]|nr:hypothetical protein [Clostridia bacterium]
MVRWVKLFGDQYLGFWALGAILFAVQEIPYMLMPLFHLKADPIMTMTETSRSLDVCEKLLGSLCVALTVFVVHREAKPFSVSDAREKLFFALAVILLLANFSGWALYFTGHQGIPVMMLFIVALPPLYYAAIGLWRRNTPLSVCGVLFLAVHFIHVLRNLKGGM